MWMPYAYRLCGGCHVSRKAELVSFPSAFVFFGGGRGLRASHLPKYLLVLFLWVKIICPLPCTLSLPSFHAMSPYCCSLHKELSFPWPSSVYFAVSLLFQIIQAFFSLMSFLTTVDSIKLIFSGPLLFLFAIIPALPLPIYWCHHTIKF